MVNFSPGVVGSKSAGGAESVHEGCATVSGSFPATLGLGGGLGGGAVLVSAKKALISSIVGPLAGCSSRSLAILTCETMDVVVRWH